MTSRRAKLKASRPALTDLRFRGDPCVVVRDDQVAICLGDYPLALVPVVPFDVPTLNRMWQQVRLGEAKRVFTRRIQKSVSA